jgi:hypothetical protein
MLEKHEHLTVINAAGNHDPDSTQWIQLALSLYFENEPRVTIVQDASAYHFYSFGNVLLGVTHGDGAKMEELPKLWRIYAHKIGVTLRIDDGSQATSITRPSKSLTVALSSP